MNRAGAIELLMPVVQPAELWQESGRWQKYGPERVRETPISEEGFVGAGIGAAGAADLAGTVSSNLQRPPWAAAMVLSYLLPAEAGSVCRHADGSLGDVPHPQVTNQFAVLIEGPCQRELDLV